MNLEIQLNHPNCYQGFLTTHPEGHSTNFRSKQIAVTAIKSVWGWSSENPVQVQVLEQSDSGNNNELLPSNQHTAKNGSTKLFEELKVTASLQLKNTQVSLRG